MTTGPAHPAPTPKPRQESPPILPPALPPPTARHLWILWLIIACLGAGIAVVIIRAQRTQSSTVARSRGNPYGDKGVPVDVATVTQGDLPVYITGLLGTVTPLQTVTIHTQVNGQLIKIAFKEGQIVHEGDILFQIDPSPFQAQLQVAQGQLAHDQALLADAKLDLTRYLSAHDAYTDQQRDTQKALVLQYEGNVKTDQGQVASAQVNLDYCTIRSPVTGRVGLQQVDLGNIVSTASTTGLVVLTQLQPITVVFPMREQDIPDVIGNAQVVPPLEVEARDEQNDPKLLATGKLYAIDSAINTASATVNLKAIFENKNNELFPSQFVNIKLLVKTLHDVVLAPQAAIQLGPDGSFVYAVNTSDMTVDVQPVTLGPSEGDTASITKGLSPGQIVVTAGVDKLSKGAKVSFEQPGAATRTSATTRSGGHRHKQNATTGESE